MILAAWTEGSRDRLTQVLGEHGLGGLKAVGSYKQALEVGRNLIAASVLGIESGFETDAVAIVGRAGHPRRSHGAPDAPTRSAAPTSSPRRTGSG